MKIKKRFISICMLLAVILTCASPSLIYADDKTCHLDLNFLIDGQKFYSGDSTICTVDVYINGKLYANDVSDYNIDIPYGSEFEIKDIKTASGHICDGLFEYEFKYDQNMYELNNSFKGEINYDTNLFVIIDSKPIEFKFYRNYNEDDLAYVSQTFDLCAEAQKITDKGLSRIGYTLLGWSTNRNSKDLYFSTLDNVDNHHLLAYYNGLDLYAVWQPNTYDVVINPNGGTIEKDDSTDMTKNDDGSISLSPTYDSNDFSSVNISPSRTGYTFDGIYDADTDGNQVWDSNGAFVEGKYWDKNGNWIYDGNVTLYCHWKPIDYTMTFDYNKNGELTNADIDSKTVTYDSPYGELPNPGCAGWAFKEWNTKADGSGSTITKDDICKGDISVYALWSYKPVNVSVPQTLIGDKNGNSEFVVKSDDIESGSIDVTIPDGFYYNQEGKSPVYASISTDGDSKLTKDNTAIKYSIITDGLTAGCWSGVFNIGLKLTKSE